jgi:nitrate reductase assembly molybdenum cofactor insertion protein NarJ
MNLYGYFSLLFSYPTKERMKEIADLSQDADVSPLRSPAVLANAPLEEVQAEYTRLFISAYPKLLCPPYESYYREGVVYGNSSIEVKEWYGKQGLCFACESEPPDVLGAELDYLALTNDGAFLARMKEWVFEFTRLVQQNSTLYGIAAAEMEEFLKQAPAAEGRPVADEISPAARD